MNQEPATSRGVLRRSNVRMLGQPALVECGGKDPAGNNRAIAVVPLLDGARIAGFEVRCGCGSAAIVECVYTTEAAHD